MFNILHINEEIFVLNYESFLVVYKLKMLFIVKFTTGLTIRKQKEGITK